MTNDPLIGRQLDEYLLEELLGQGGMARVYRAVDVRLKRYAAIKVIGSDHLADPDYARRFSLEAQAIARLTHPNIVHLYRYGRTDDDLLYMAMQYIEGMDLGTLLQGYWADSEFMALDDVARVIGQVCAALDYAHDQGVIHRDIKPANIMLDRQGNAHLADFGLVLLTEVGTRGEIFGTPHYIAPEQAISSSGATPQSDLYSVGVILYEMFTGVLPFDAENPLEVAMLHMSQIPRPPHNLRPEITPALESVILKALEKDPPERYPTGASLSQALDKALREKRAMQMRTSRKTVYSRVIAGTSSLPLPPETRPEPKTAPPTKPATAPATRPKSAPSRQSQATLPNVSPPTQPKTAPARQPHATPPTLPKASPSAQPGPTAPTKPKTPPARPKTEPRMYLPEVPIPAPPSPSGPPARESPPPTPSESSAVTIPEPLLFAPAAPARVPPPPPDNPARPSWLIPAAIGGGALIILLFLVFLGQAWLRGRALDKPTATPTLAAGVVETPQATTPGGSLATPVVETPAVIQATAAPAATPTAEPSPAPPAPARLLIARGKEESVWLINQGEGDFVLAPLLLKSGEKSVAGDVWGIATLKPGECVVIVQDKEPKDSPKPCAKVGSWKSAGTKKDLFGRPSIEVFYGDQRVRECRENEKECVCDMASVAP